MRDGKFWFNARQHDERKKTVFGQARNFNGGDIIELCLARKSCAEFLAFKLLRTFVLDQPAEAQVAALAGRIREHDLAMAPVMRDLLGSRLFFSEAARAAIIKSPLDLVLGAARALGGRANLQRVGAAAARLGQDIFQPPSVKGWEGGRLWINSAMLLQRANFAGELLLKKSMGAIDDPSDRLMARGLKGDAEVIDHYLDLLLANDAEPAARNRLAGFLKSAPGGRDEQLRGLIHLMMTMPDYQLM